MRAAVVVVLACVALCWVAAPAAAGAKKKRIPTSVVFVIDRSGSMMGEKLETTKKAVIAAIDSMAPSDRASLVIFDAEATVVFQEQPRTKRASLVKLVNAIKAGGGTNYFPGLKEASDILMGVSRERKHVILLSDGEAPRDGLEELVTDMRVSRITVSAIGVEGASQELLAEVASNGDGRLWMAGDVVTLPQLFVRELRGD